MDTRARLFGAWQSIQRFLFVVNGDTREGLALGNDGLGIWGFVGTRKIEEVLQVVIMNRDARKSLGHEAGMPFFRLLSGLCVFLLPVRTCPSRQSSLHHVLFRLVSMQLNAWKGVAH